MSELSELVAAGLKQKLGVTVEASGRHVHLTEAHIQALFGAPLTEKSPLSQPGQYLSHQRVSLLGSKGRLDKVAVLGPARPESQVELSLTDARLLGVDAPVRLSGEIDNTPGITLQGPCGEIRLERGVIVARRHIHMTPADAARLGLSSGDEIRIRSLTDRPVVFRDVSVRVSPSFQTRVHIDYDEANACGMRGEGLGLILP